MLWSMSYDELLIFFAFISGVAYILGWFCDRILSTAGLGHVGNWLAILTGSFVGMYAYNLQGYRLTTYPEYTLAVIVGSALMTFITLCMLKRIFA